MKLRLTKESLILLLVILLALVLRFWKWPDYLVFDHEKTRDLLDSLIIYQQQNITLLGPTTEIDGVFHGPLYYYLVGFFYFLTGGDPRSGSIISFGFNLFGILTLYYIGRNLFNKRVALIAAFLYAVSFESISYSYWLSNPGPSIPLIFLMFYFFYKFITNGYQKFSPYLALSLFCYGLMIQFQVLNFVFFIPLLILFIFSKKHLPSLKTVGAALLAFLISISTFIVYELKYDFLMTKGIFGKVFVPLFSGGGGGGEAAHPVLAYLPRMVNLSNMVFFPVQYWIGAAFLAVILATVLYKIYKTRDLRWTLLLVWIFSTLPVFFIPSRISSGYSAFIGVAGALILVVAYLLNSLLSKTKVGFFLFLAIFLTVNLYAVNNYLTNYNLRLFDYFQGLSLKTEFELIDYVYEDTNGIQFKTDTVTSPLFISKTWDYLFDWRGNNKYGRTPKREGQPVIGYLILEPYAPVAFKEKAIEKANIEGDLVEVKKFGEITIEKRNLKYNQ